MKRVLVIGCPGAGKSTFSRKLSAKTGLPLHYLDMIWHKPDKTNVSQEKFDEKLEDMLESFNGDIVCFKSRTEADSYIDSL